MEALDERLMREWLVPPGIETRVLYHYTSAAGLIGILSSGTIRGTSASFLNDTSEIQYGLSVCMDVLAEERSARTAEVERKLLERAIEVMRDDTVPNEVYVTSFSARRDVLSQWRAYGSAEGRFCIGFELSQFSERDLLQFPRPVEYSQDAQRQQVRRAIDLTCRVAAEPGADTGHTWRCATSLTFHLRRIMCSFKHPGFHEEEEWRSITTIGPWDGTGLIQFEPFRGMPRPFTNMLSGSRTSGRLPVIEVCVGHTERKPAVYRATRLLLDKCGHSDAGVTETGIPFAG